MAQKQNQEQIMRARSEQRRHVVRHVRIFVIISNRILSKAFYLIFRCLEECGCKAHVEVTYHDIFEEEVCFASCNARCDEI